MMDNKVTSIPANTIQWSKAMEACNNADKMAESALSKTALPIYVEYITPFYRVRVGDFTERSEAEECVKLLKEKGFSGALWVYANINTQ